MNAEKRLLTEELQRSFEWNHDSTIRVIKTDAHPLIHKILYKIAENSDSEDAYKLLEDAINFIVDLRDQSEEKILDEAISHGYESVYVADLTKWLAGSITRVTDVNEAMQDAGLTDICSAIAYAQDRRFEMAVSIILDYLENNTEENE